MKVMEIAVKDGARKLLVSAWSVKSLRDGVILTWTVVRAGVSIQ